MKFEGTFKERLGCQDFYEVEVDQGGDTVLIYTVSESDLAWLNAKNKSKWDVKFVATSVREL